MQTKAAALAVQDADRTRGMLWLFLPVLAGSMLVQSGLSRISFGDLVPARAPAAKSSLDMAAIAAAQLARAEAKQCLAQAVYYEARGERLEGQEAVAQVVLNRVRAPKFPKSVCGVVFQGAQRGHGCQFSFACDGSMKRALSPEAWVRAETVAEQAMSGRVFAAVGSATHYHSRAVSPYWSGSMKRLTSVGAHIFYAPKTRAPKTQVA